MKPVPTEATPRTAATVEFEVQFSRGPRGRKRLPASTPMATGPPRPEPAARPTPGPSAAAGAHPARAFSLVEVTPAPGPVPTARLALPLQSAVTARTPEASPRTEQPAPGPRVPKVALLLVLGHHFERLVRDGIVKDYAEIARRTGMTRARVTQICNLTLLVPEIQNGILSHTAQGVEHVHERSLRAIVAEADWSKQCPGHSPGRRYPVRIPGLSSQ